MSYFNDGVFKGALSGLRLFLATETPVKMFVYQAICEPDCDVMDFEVNLIFLIKPFFIHDQKFMTKT